MLARRLVSDPARVVASMNAAFPTPDNLGRHFVFGTSLFQIQLPEALDAEMITAGDRQELLLAREEASQSAKRKDRRGRGDAPRGLRGQPEIADGNALRRDAGEFQVRQDRRLRTGYVKRWHRLQL